MPAEPVADHAAPSRRRGTTWAAMRAALALATAVSITADYDYVLGFRAFSASNFFAYFTTLSAIASVVVTAGAALHTLRGRPRSRSLTALRSLVLTYVVVSGIVFAVIVAEARARDYPLDVPWSSAMLHFVLPALLVAEWILGPGDSVLDWRLLPLVLVFPVLWGVVTLIRGSVVGWYPYFFLDPGQVDMPFGFLAYVSLSLGIFVGVMALLILSTRRRDRPRRRRGSSGPRRRGPRRIRPAVPRPHRPR
jgi:hypothetical protein